MILQTEHAGDISPFCAISEHTDSVYSSCKSERPLHDIWRRRRRRGKLRRMIKSDE
jgi:hypothetical protein